MSDLVLNALKRKLVNATGTDADAIKKRIKALEKKAAPPEPVFEQVEAEAPAESEGEA